MKKLFIGMVALSVLVAGCGNNPKSSQEQQMPLAEEIATKVEVAAAELMDVPQEGIYTSTVQANAVNNVVPQSGGRIVKINAEIGDYVYAGQVLAEMERVNLEQSRLKLANDSTELARLKELFLAGGISRSDYESVELAYNVSRSQYNNLLENTILRSPLTGVVTARNYDRGDMYAMASPIFVVQQITPVKLLVGISETDYMKVSKGDKVSITADAIPGRTFEGTVSRIYPTIDAATHTFTAEVKVGNSDRILRPGMYSRVTVQFAVNSSIVIPDMAVLKQQGSGQRAVYVLREDNTVEYRVVELGKHFGSSYEILSGLGEGEKVVTKGHTALKNGSKVTL